MSRFIRATESLNYASEAARLDNIRQVLGQSRLEQPLARCIAPLLVALDWLGAPQGLLESLPQAGQTLTLADLQELLDQLGFQSRMQPWSPARSLPTACLLQRGETVLVYLGRHDGQEYWHDGEQIVTAFQPRSGDLLLKVRKAAEHQPVDAAQPGWLTKLLLTARREVSGVLLVSLMANLLTLSISLFTMFVYNSIIPSGAMTTLMTVTLAAVIAVIGGWGLRLARAKVLARMTAWAGAKIGNLAYRKTLGLPLEISARVGTDSNLSRLRSIENVRQWFGGAGGAVSADYPFAIIFLLTIALLGGWIVLVPLCSLLLFAALAKPMAWHVEGRAKRVGVVSRPLNDISATLAQHLRGLNGVAGSVLWYKRIAEMVADVAEANRQYAQATGLAQVLAQSLSSLTVLATMGVGVSLVLQGTMSTGGLIASMMLIWRITTPAQQMFSSQVRLRQLADSTRQLDRLLQTVGEMANPQSVAPISELQHDIQIDRLYYRYNADREAALNGVSFAIPAGQLIAVVGPNGAGKTTLLEILAGIRQPQSGRVLVGGRDIRQFDPGDYRAWTGYLPQQVHGLPIPVREALTLRYPVASDTQLSEALARIAGEQWWRLFGANTAEQGLSQIIDPWSENPDDVRNRMIVRLTSATLEPPAIILLDDPIGDRDPVLDGYLRQLLGTLRGRSTIVMATHRPDLICLADQVAILNEGGLAHFGPVAPQAQAAQPASIELTGE
ncbi:MAG: ATP-binding cassette domain-containing protein [Pseudomonas sp.]|nr:ATP-binding cassette domain-containing protein [Pseudomonas sp.]